MKYIVQTKPKMWALGRDWRDYTTSNTKKEAVDNLLRAQNERKYDEYRLMRRQTVDTVVR